MANEGQQPPLPPQGPQRPPDYYGWQYDQEHPEMSALPPGVPPTPPYPQQQSPHGTRQQPLLTRYQEPIHDMGTSLGYGQGMEYQYFDAPQPSQPMAQLRMERLQQLREERMRRQQRRIGQDITTVMPFKRGAKLPSPPDAIPVSPVPPSASPLPNPAQMSPMLSVPSVREASPPYAPMGVPVTTRSSVEQAPDEQLQPAGAPAQDTGMLQSARIRRASLILTAAFVASRVLGLLRTIMFAYVFGTTDISDAYLQAFLVPDLIFNIVAGGALSSAFIPVFTKYMIGERDEKTAWHIASSALNLAIAIMMVLALIAIFFARQVVPIYNPGVPAAKLDLIASLMRIMLIQAIVLGAGVIVNAVLNARQDFRLPAIGTVLYNVGLIVGLLPGIYFASRGQRDDVTAIYAATFGVVVGAFLQVGIQIPGLVKVGMRYTLSFDWKHPGVIQVGRQMIPRVVNAAMLYLATFIDRGLIPLLAAWALAAHLVSQTRAAGLVTQYYQSLQLVLLPLGIFGMAVSTAAFPTLAENVAKGRLDRVRGTILETLRSILFMSIPSSVGLMVLAFPIIQALLEHGRFTREDALSTVVPLVFFAVGLAGLAAVEILTRSFYALRDSTTPVIISVGQFAFKIALSLILINLAVFGVQWGLGALAFSTSLAGLLEAIVLFWLLHQRLGGLQIRTIGNFVGRVVLASLAMGIILLVTRFILDGVFALLAVLTHLSFLNTPDSPSLGIPGTIVALMKLLVELFIGVLVYIRAARMFGIEELGPVKRVLDRLRLSWI